MVEHLYSIRDCGKAVGDAAHKIAYVPRANPGADR
jgi:hypothetical protein